MGEILLSIAMFMFPAQNVIAIENPIVQEVIEYEQKLDEAIKILSWCESRDKNTAVNPKDPILSSNGRFQFKRKTWKWAIERYDLFPYADEDDLENLLWDGSAQETVVRAMMTENRWTHWKICGKKAGLDKLKYPI